MFNIEVNAYIRKFHIVFTLCVFHPTERCGRPLGRQVHLMHMGHLCCQLVTDIHQHPLLILVRHTRATHFLTHARACLMSITKCGETDTATS